MSVNAGQPTNPLWSTGTETLFEQRDNGTIESVRLFCKEKLRNFVGNLGNFGEGPNVNSDFN